jgi:S1-C subfamily serine protease
MNFKNLIAAGIIGFSSLFGVAQASTLQEIADSTYKFYIGGRAGCSAVAVSETKLVTAFHCVANGNNFAIAVQKLGPNFEVLSMEVIFADVIRGLKGKDVALLEIRDGKLPTFVDIASADYMPKFGDSLIAVGYPMVVDLTVTHGVFTGFVPLPELGMEGGFYKTTVPVTGGSSGGGLYAPVKGGEYNLVGLTTGGYQHVDFMTYFSNTQSLNEVIKNLLHTAPKYEGAGKESGGLINPSDLR